MTTKLKFKFEELDKSIQRSLIQGYWHDNEIRSWSEGTRFPCEVSARDTQMVVVQKFLREIAEAGIQYHCNIAFDHNYGLLDYNAKVLTKDWEEFKRLVIYLGADDTLQKVMAIAFHPNYCGHFYFDWQFDGHYRMVAPGEENEILLEEDDFELAHKLISKIAAVNRVILEIRAQLEKHVIAELSRHEYRMDGLKIEE